MNFDTIMTSNTLQNVAVHHQHAQHPIARHAYRISQVIDFGLAAPHTFVH